MRSIPYRTQVSKMISFGVNATTSCRYKPELLPEISRESGVTIVVGTAFYVDAFLSSEAKNMSIEQVSQGMSI